MTELVLYVWVTSAYIQIQKPTKVRKWLNWNLRKFLKIVSRKMSEVKNRKINSHLSQVTSNKLSNNIPTPVLSNYNWLHFTYHGCSLWSFSAQKKVDHKLHRKSSDWSEIIGNFSKAIHYRRPKPFVFGIIDTRDSLVKVTVNNKDVNIDFQKMSHRKMKKSDHKLHFDHKLNRFFDHKLGTPLYMKIGP